MSFARFSLPVAILLLFVPASVVAEEPPAYVGGWGRYPGGGLGSFTGIRAILATSDVIYVTDAPNGRIKMLTHDYGFRGVFGFSGGGPGQFMDAAGLAMDGSGRLYVADFGGYRIEVFDRAGTFIREWGEPGSGPGQLERPIAVAVDGDGWVYVADKSDRIQRFSSTGVFQDAWGGPDTFHEIASMVLAADNTLYIGDAGDRVLAYSTSGAFIRQWGGSGPDPGQFSGPLGLAVDPAGNVLVADSGNYRVQKFTAGGQFLSQWGTRGSEEGQFDKPVVVAADGPDRVLVGEGYNARVQEFCFGAACQPTYTPPPLLSTPKILLSAVAAPLPSPCTVGAPSECRDAVTAAGLAGTNGQRYYVFLLVSRPDSYDDGIAGVQCGIDYQTGGAGDVSDGQGLDILSWTLCATLEFPTPGDHAWPRPGGGNLITWDPANCDYLRPSVAGYFYVAAYSDDRLRLTVRPVDGLAAVAACKARQINLLPASLGYVSFSAGAGTPGCNPCLKDDCEPGGRTFRSQVPVTPMSWGSIKALYGGE